MGLSSAWEEILKPRYLSLGQNNFPPEEEDMTIRTERFEEKDSEIPSSKSSKESSKLTRKNSINLKNCEPLRLMLETQLPFKGLVQDFTKPESNKTSCKKSEEKPRKSLPAFAVPEPSFCFSPQPIISKFESAVVTVQKVYKSYRTRRNRADCTVVVEELWWKALDFAALKRSSVSFFDVEKPETAISKWSRARTRAAKV